MNNNPIGILDSGVGGLTVWKELINELPHESTVYIADSQHAPYGEKSPEEIYHLAKRLIDFLISKDVKLIIIACNTITVSCLDRLRHDYPGMPMIGTVPVVKTAAAVTRNKKIGILSTTRTAESAYQKELIHTFAAGCEVTTVGTDKLVPFIEKGIVNGKEIQEVIADALQPFIEQHCDAIALGCTHFPFLAEQMQQLLGPDVKLLEPSGAIARHARRVLSTISGLSTSSHAEHFFFTTGDESHFKRLLPYVLPVERTVPYHSSSLTI